MTIGGFVSASGGLDNAIRRAHENGFEVAMFFIGSPHSWRLPILSEEDVIKYKKAKQASIVKRAYTHALYLANLATGDDEQYEKTINALTTTLQNGNKIALEGVIFHPGSHKNTSVEKGMKRVAEGMERILENSPGNTKLILEFVVQQGDKVGTSFEQLKQIISSVDKTYRSRVAVCFDTCHGFAMGYNYSDSVSLQSLIEDVKSTVGLSTLQVFHINDSVHPLNSHKDRHANIGEGYIGLKGFKALLNTREFNDKDFILEVPGKDNQGPSKSDLNIIKSLMT